MYSFHILGPSMTVEFLTTTMCLVEETLNARGITPSKDDPSNLEALTPLFILGRVNVCIPIIPDAEIYSNIRKMMRSCQDCADIVWKRKIT